jgi:hypothetical protein
VSWEFFSDSSKNASQKGHSAIFGKGGQGKYFGIPVEVCVFLWFSRNGKIKK